MITQYTHKLMQNGAIVRYLKMSDGNARKLLAEERQYFNGLSLVKGPLRYDTRKNGIVER